jgi:hypothetical protein
VTAEPQLNLWEPPVARIPLRRKTGGLHGYALIDPDDLALISGRSWHLTTQGYARSNRPGGGFDYLHRFLFGLEDGDRREVDHISRDKLDNRRSNLRVLSRAENQQNVGAIGRSGIRGAIWDGTTGRWRAVVKLAGHTYHLGRCDSPEEAGARAAAFRREHMPYAAD